jgi:photosystem II stability/assembly factor-like uncharacterized protein
MRYIQLFLILLSINLSAQSSWQNTPNILTNTNNQRFDDVFFLDANTGWVANGANASVHKTTDGGLSWTEQLNQTDLGSGHYFRNIEFLNANIGFLGTLNGKFYKTIDGGSNWTEEIITPNPTAICGLDAVGTSTIYGCGAYFTPAHIIKSINSGDTWQYIDMSAYADALVDIYFLTEDIGFASGKSSLGGTVLKTVNGGATWTELYNTGIVGQYVWKLQILENNTDVIFGSVESSSPNPGQLIKSLDGGINWISYDAPETNIQAVGFINENHGWMGGHTTGFHETLDGGVTWNNLNIGNNLNKIFIISPTLAYASGASIYKYTEDTLGTDVFEENPRTPLDITFTNNPVSSTLAFSITFKANDNLLINLYDINGKHIKQLAKDTITSKTTTAYSFPVKNLASGVYILDFHNDTGRESRKFIKK